jgi:hypothetical protein
MAFKLFSDAVKTPAGVMQVHDFSMRVGAMISLDAKTISRKKHNKPKMALYIIEWVIKLHLAAKEINHIDEVV